MGSEVWTQSKIAEKLADDEALTMALVPRILLNHQLKREVYHTLGRPTHEPTPSKPDVEEPPPAQPAA